ncbi:MAG: tetratricopeptide repeat protein [Acidobacteriota bacterium]
MNPEGAQAPERQVQASSLADLVRNIEVYMQEDRLAADNRAKLQKEAERYMIQGKISQAIGEYLKIVRMYPEDVLTANTVGDLYLSIGRMDDANKYFINVAKTYVRNNFFLKAIAVYKKILRTDPDNLEINSAIASLYARQGLHIDACNQYLRLVELYENTGNREKVLETYEKIVELDPANAKIQKKLAEVFLEKQEAGKARAHLLKAARALTKSGNYTGALDCYSQSVQIEPTEIDGLKGYMECCIKTGNVSVILDQLNESLTKDPDNQDICLMLGEAYLAEDNPEAALEILKTLVTSDESRYEGFFPVLDALIAQGRYEQASEALDPIIPILITRRRADVAIKYCEQILQGIDVHVPTMEKLASLHLSAGDVPNHLEVLDKIVDYYVEGKDPATALEYLEKILKADPESKKHLDLHKIVFLDAFPDKPYIPPQIPPESHIEQGTSQNLQAGSEETDNTPESIVEADLLINYGMKEKAIGLLQNMETSDPSNKKVRTRLLMLFKENDQFTEAAEQCLLLAALYKKSKDEESSDRYLSEAKQLDPDLFERASDLEAFALKKGINLGSGSNNKGGLKPDNEVDLSGDLLDIFFAEHEEDTPKEPSDIPAIHREMPEEYSEELPPVSPTQSIEEKLQEVDFYIRLGFSEEASNKLNEIAKTNPEHPELPPRFEKLKQIAESESAAEEGMAVSDGQDDDAPKDAADGEAVDIFQDGDLDTSSGNINENSPDAMEFTESIDFSSLQEEGTTDTEEQAGAGSNPAVVSEINGKLAEPMDSSSRQQQENTAEEQDKPEVNLFVDNAMFSDLLEEVSSLNDQELEKENFEDHFSLGTAYRDMDLVDEAIKEFQTALRIAEHSKDSPKLIQCCGMLSTCFIKKSMPRSALRWCQTGLSVNHISDQEAIALRYDMGVSHEMEGNPDLALQCFDQIFSIDPGYRDVAYKIDEIKSDRREV